MCTFRLRRFGMIFGLCLVLALAAGMTAISGARARSAPAFGWFKSPISCATAQQRLDYIESCGWAVEAEPFSELEVLIPAEFDEVYRGYDQLQTKQGFKLSKYKGKTAVKYSYRVTNYPDKNAAVAASLLVCKDKLIAADLSSMELGGFIKALAKEV